MAHLLKNKNLEILIDLPGEHYNFSRFDWTGKISEVKYQNILFSSVEEPKAKNEHVLGKGFYNEFGIDTPLGFGETPIGGWFHKIGVGLLKKEDKKYLFNKNYKIKAAKFETGITSDSISIDCISESNNGYSYILKKVIAVNERGFTINYTLQNTGVKDIITDEYVHNFTAIKEALVGPDYILKFPFRLMSGANGEIVNPDNKVVVIQNEIRFNSTPNKPFFFSKLSGNDHVTAQWYLRHLKHGFGISESGDFLTNKINLWGCRHVISPELFFHIHLQPDKLVSWSRVYKFHP